MTARQHLSKVIEELYGVFGVYARPERVELCSYCYDPDEINALNTTPLRGLDPELTRMLIWEASDHFDSTEVYKHFLPRILEHLAPPICCEDIYEDHLFETLKAHHFEEWPATERASFWAYVVAVYEAFKESDKKAARQWRIAAGKLDGCPYSNDEFLTEDPLNNPS